MKKVENREIEIQVCDFCGAEKPGSNRMDKCGICGKDMCNPNIHTAYSVEAYRYADGKRVAGIHDQVCQECSTKTGLNKILDRMIDRKN